ncbi:hypothetical protein ABT354_30490 [Streptomyces sp. NPDC000594]|uniref:hypothetical protein n=1 Tax=Streptomyces sp. NPDC000594 TaxID=3154261 RepID=UPI00332681C1
MAELDWAGALEEAREATGYSGEIIPRTVGAVRSAVRPGRHAEFDRELGALDRGAAFDVFLDHWWTQALADSALDEDSQELALEFADLAVALHVRGQGGPAYTPAEIERMITGAAS